MGDVRHATLVFERRIAAPPRDVFQALADVKARLEWGVPSDTATVIYDAADFCEGGEDRFRCGSKADPNIHGHTRYHDIVPGRRIVSSETITVGGKRLCVSLTTVELTEAGDGTLLKSTTQLASFIGEDMLKGHEQGNNASLDNLVRHFAVKAGGGS